jgi:type 1 fimbria pilin
MFGSRAPIQSGEAGNVPDAGFVYAASATAFRSRAISIVFHIVLIALGLCCTPAHATLKCEVANFNKVLVAGVIALPITTATGTTVSTVAPDAFQIVCTMQNDAPTTSDTISLAFKTSQSPVSGFSDVYATNVAGLGVRYTFNSADCQLSNVVMQNGAASVSCYVTGTPGQVIQPNLTVTATFVVTGAIASGASLLSTAPSVTTVLTQASAPGYSWGKNPLYTGAATGTLTRATCSVSQADVAVVIPTANTRAFGSGVGAVAGAQPFSLTFDCASGAKVLITLTDSVNPANRSNTLQITADSTAAGLGVQVLNSSGSPVSFGLDSAAPGNPNQWLIGASPNGPLQVPLTARYIRTGAVSAGTVRALATFTLSYQ